MSLKSIAISICSIFSLTACMHVDAPESGVNRMAKTGVREDPIGGPARNQIVPLLDAHQHMMSPAAMALTTRPATPPVVTVPSIVADLLKARGQGVDEKNYETLYTPDAMIHAEEHDRWWTGKERILDALSTFGALPTERFVPTSYALQEAAGYVAGVLRRDTGKDTHNFMFGLKKGADGRWRIATEMKQEIAPPSYAPVVDAEKIIYEMDDAGIRYATVLSLGYWFGDPDKQIEDRHAKTRAENDWVVAQTQKYPGRLIPFCGVNPVDDYAIAELKRCAAIPAVRGMKIHRNSKFRTGNPEHLEKLQRFFRAANDHGLAIVIHIRDTPEAFIDKVLPEAPDIPIQIAHMGSGMPALKTFAEAIEAGKPGTKNLWFDWTQALPIEDLWVHGNPGGFGGAVTPQKKAEMVGLMRRVGLGRVLFGTDMPLPWNPSPRDWWRKTILTLPLTDEEIGDIADNLPPYVRKAGARRAK